MAIDKDRIYRPQDAELREIAAVQTLAKWRHEERGPSWTYAGSRVLYRGQDILEWLSSNTIQLKGI